MRDRVVHTGEGFMLGVMVSLLAMAFVCAGFFEPGVGSMPRRGRDLWKGRESVGMTPVALQEPCAAGVFAKRLNRRAIAGQRSIAPVMRAQCAAISGSSLLGQVLDGRATDRVADSRANRAGAIGQEGLYPLGACAMGHYEAAMALLQRHRGRGSDVSLGSTHAVYLPAGLDARGTAEVEAGELLIARARALCDPRTGRADVQSQRMLTVYQNNGASLSRSPQNQHR